MPVHVSAVDSPIGRFFLKLSTLCGFMRAVCRKKVYTLRGCTLGVMSLKQQMLDLVAHLLVPPTIYKRPFNLQ